MFPDRGYGLMLLLWLLGAGVAQAAIEAHLPMDGKKIVTASAVQVRQGPSVNTAVLGRLKLGVTVQASARTRTEVSVGQLRGYWYQVSDGRLAGWVFGAFLRDFDAAKQEAIWLELARSRSTNKHLGFADYADTFGFISSVLPQVRDKVAGVELEFNRLLVLQRSVDQIPFGQGGRQPYKRWLERHTGRVFYDEISAQWLVRAEDFWQLADRIPNTRLGDDIALYAANAPLGGECEGDPACNLGRMQMTDGEYLKRYPRGRHVSKVLQAMDEVLVFIQQELQRQPGYFRGDVDSGRVLQELLARVEATQAPERQQVMQRLLAIRSVSDKSR